jgi:hypothetical protein
MEPSNTIPLRKWGKFGIIGKHSGWCGAASATIMAQDSANPWACSNVGALDSILAIGRSLGLQARDLTKSDRAQGRRYIAENVRRSVQIKSKINDAIAGRELTRLISQYDSVIMVKCARVMFY